MSTALEPATSDRDRRLPTRWRPPALTMAAIAFTALVVVCLIAGSLVTPQDPDKQNVLLGAVPPGSGHILGTDQLGRDVLSRLIVGTRPALIGPLCVAVGATLIGSSLGLLAGFRGGAVDSALRRFADLIFSLPALLVAVVVIGVVQGGYWLAAAILLFLSIAWQIRLARSATLVQARLPYVDSARTLDVSDLRIMGAAHPPEHPADHPRRVSARFRRRHDQLLGAVVPWPRNRSGKCCLGGDARRRPGADHHQPVAVARPGGADHAHGSQRDVDRRLGVRRALAGRRAGVSDADAPSANDDARAAPLLSVRGLMVDGKRGGSERVLVRELDFDLGAGETVAIVGESGSGKSITARALVGLLPAGVSASGSVSLAGDPLLTTRSPRMRAVRGVRIALLLQDPFTMLNPVQTVRAHIIESLPREERRTRAIARGHTRRRLHEVGLSYEQVADSYPFQLSGGTLQRVAVAAALARDPELLIADEPTTALDASAQAGILELLGRLQRRRGMALLLITHDLRVAFSMSDRVLVMYAGTILEQGPASAVLRAAEHPYTLGLLLAEPPVAQSVEQLSAIPGKTPSPRRDPRRVCLR